MNNQASQSPLGLRRGLGDRLLFGALALTMGILSGYGCWLAFFRSTRPSGAAETLTLFAVHEAVLAVFILCVLAVIWSLATPSRLERLLERRAPAAFIAVLVAAPIVVLWIWLSS